MNSKKGSFLQFSVMLGHIENDTRDIFPQKIP